MRLERFCRMNIGEERKLGTLPETIRFRRWLRDKSVLKMVRGDRARLSKLQKAIKIIVAGRRNTRRINNEQKKKIKLLYESIVKRNEKNKETMRLRLSFMMFS